MRKKNVLMIVTDQHRIDTIGCINENSLVNTPNINSLGYNGAIFKNCYCSNPVCTPARSSLQLGLYPSKTGFETNSFEVGSRTHMLPDVEFSLPRRLQRAGYQTAYTGKWHLGLPKDKSSSIEGNWFLTDYYENKNMSCYFHKDIGSLPSDHGYIGDDFEGHGIGGWNAPLYRKYLRENNLELTIEEKMNSERPGDHTNWGVITSGINSTVEHFLVERSKSIIKSLDKTRPFYFQVNFWGPHEPFYVPSEYYDKYKDLKIKSWENFTDDKISVNDILRRPDTNWSFFEESLKHYYAYIEYIDFEIGNIISYLKKENIYDDTVIIFTSDHGDYQGTHGQLENKSYGLYEDITRIPFIINDKIHTGIYENLCQTCDIYETILDYCGVDLTEFASDGNSILRIFANESWDNRVMSESMGAYPFVISQRMYRRDNLKYIYLFGSSEQIYDIDKDPFELNNLAEDKILLDKLRKECYKNMKDNKDPAADMFAKMHRLDEWQIKGEDNV